MPTLEITRIAEQFGGQATPQLLSGGQGHSWKVATVNGAIVLKPSPNYDEARWIGEAFSRLAFAPEVRVPCPLTSVQGEWVCENHVAWTWLDGLATGGSYRDKIVASRAFHAELRSLERPEFIDRRTDPWAMADRVAWGEAPADYDAHTMAALSPVLSMIEENQSPNRSQAQLIHADLSGNYVFSQNKAPGIIDITPYWRPEGFAEAVIWVDSIWFSEEIQPDLFSRPAMREYVLRALARRIAEQPEQVRAGMKLSNEAASVVAKLSNAVGKLLEPWGLK